MFLWRIRITLPDEPHQVTSLRRALADTAVHLLQVVPKGGDSRAVSADFVIELPDDERLGAVLGVLHQMSPQVYLSRIEQPDMPSWPPGIGSVPAAGPLAAGPLTSPC